MFDVFLVVGEALTLMRAIMGLACADALILGAALRHNQDCVVVFLIAYAPVLTLVLLSSSVDSLGFRQGALLLETIYSVLAAAIVWWTFSGDRDAGYQLTLLLIPLAGFLTILVAGAAAFSVKRQAITANRDD